MDTVGTAAINIGTQAAAKTITIGNDASTKVDINALAIELDSAAAMTLSSVGAIGMDTVGTAAINIGTEAAAKTITVGDDASAKVDVNALIIELDSAGTIIANSVTTTEITSGTSMTLSSGAGTTGIIKINPGTGGLITKRAVQTIGDSVNDATAAQYVAGFINCTSGGANTWTLPTGSVMADAMPGDSVSVGDSFICYVVNASGGDITYEGATGAIFTACTSGAALTQKTASLARLEFIFTDATDGNEVYHCLLIAEDA